MTDIISFDKVIEHERLTDRLRNLRPWVKAAQTDAPDAPVSPQLAFTAIRLLKDVRALVSREPGIGPLPRIDRRQPPTPRQLSGMLRDTGLALETFAWNHRDHDERYGDEWLTIEGIEYYCSEQRKLIPVH